MQKFKRNNSCGISGSSETRLQIPLISDPSRTCWCAYEAVFLIEGRFKKSPACLVWSSHETQDFLRRAYLEKIGEPKK